MLNKTCTTSVRLNAAEKSLLNSKAAEAGLKPGTYLKKVAFDYEVKAAPRIVYKRADPELIRQITWIGNNLNQIARQLNTIELSASDGLILSILLEDIGVQLKAIQNGNI